MRVVLVVHRFPEASEGFLVDHALGLLASDVDVHVLAGTVDRGRLAAVAPALVGRVHAAPAGAGGRVAVAGRTLAGLLAHPVGAARFAVRARALGRRLPPALARDLPLVALRPDVVHTEFLTLARDRTHLPAALGTHLTSSVRGYDVTYAGLADPGHYEATWPALTALHVLGDDLWRRARERGAPPDLAHTAIPPAVDADRFGPAEPPPTPPLRLLSVGRLHWKKGHHHELAALARVRAAGVDAHLRIVGDGPALEELAFARQQLGLDDHATFVRGLDRDGVAAELATAHLVVHGAVTEGFANAVLEAQAAAVAVVCTDAEGLPANVEHGVTGLVVPRRDPDALAAAILELATDPDRRAAMGAAGRRRVIEHFAPESQRAAFARFFAEVAG